MNSSWVCGTSTKKIKPIDTSFVVGASYPAMTLSCTHPPIRQRGHPTISSIFLVAAGIWFPYYVRALLRLSLLLSAGQQRHTALVLKSLEREFLWPRRCRFRCEYRRIEDKPKKGCIRAEYRWLHLVSFVYSYFFTCYLNYWNWYHYYNFDTLISVCSHSHSKFANCIWKRWCQILKFIPSLLRNSLLSNSIRLKVSRHI